MRFVMLDAIFPFLKVMLMKLKFLLVVLIILVAGAGYAQESEFVFGDALPDAPELAARGTYAVGVRTLTWVNPKQVDILHGGAEYDRELTVEVWYPAELAEGETETIVYEDSLGRADNAGSLRPFSFAGRAARDAAAHRADDPYPLVIVSHGFPGSRFMMTYLTENLASKGYVVVAIGHTESTFTDVAGFNSTLFHRAQDQEFALNQMAKLAETDEFWQGLVDADNTAVIGYSMGGYGTLNVIGAGYNATLAAFLGPAIEPRLASNADYLAKRDPRIKAAVLFAPWGGDLAAFGTPGGLWDAEGLGGITIPTFWVVGSLDDVSMAGGVIGLFDNAVNSERWLLTYHDALHNVAPNPPPPEATVLSDYERYAEPVWDERRINNVNQHFLTAFLGLHLKGEAANADYLNLKVEVASDGVYSEGNGGTYWKGFAPRTALGLSLRHETP
jgi:predicted dienelactone hydrolase